MPVWLLSVRFDGGSHRLFFSLSSQLVVRLWDTYMSEDDEDGFSVFHVYVCAAFILTWASKIKELEFQELMMFMQNLPTRAWTEKEIETLVSQAFVYKMQFHASPKQLQ